MKTLIALSLMAAVLAPSTFAGPASVISTDPTPADVLAVLVKKLGASQGVLMGRTRDEFWECGVEFAASQTEMVATFFYPNGSGKDVRGVFRLTPESKVAAFDAPIARFTVKNKFAQAGKNKPVTRASRIEVSNHADGSVKYVNIGWAEDNGYPLPMYGCLFE